MTIGDALANKTIIFFSVQTFNLEKEIICKLEKFGAKVHYFDERPSNSNFTKGIIRLKRSLYQKIIDKYYQNILKKTASMSVDYLFVNRGEVVPAFFLEEFKKLHKDCEFIFYTWDSFTNHSHPISILKYFDKKSTFDPGDALKYGINFRPLFYLDDFKNLKKEAIEYDTLFLGTAHSDRYTISSKIRIWCIENKLSMFCYYYMHGKIVYLYKRIFDETFQLFKFSELSFKSLTLKDIIALYRKSRVILDINHPHQKGLTMRTFEAIGARTKLVTTNPEITKFPFYSPNNILLIDRDDIRLNREFFEKDYEDIQEDEYRKLSMEGWLYNVFLDPEKEFWNKCL